MSSSREEEDEVDSVFVLFSSSSDSRSVAPSLSTAVSRAPLPSSVPDRALLPRKVVPNLRPSSSENATPSTVFFFFGLFPGAASSSAILLAFSSETQSAADVADGVERDLPHPCVLKPFCYLLRCLEMRGTSKGASEGVICFVAELGEGAEALQGLGEEEVAERRRRPRSS